MAKRHDWDGAPVYSIENEELALSLAPTLGNNLFRIYDKKAKREVLRTPASRSELAEAPGHAGTPLMLPPNRLRDGRFSFAGRTYQFEPNTTQGHHIHGFLRNHPWTFDEAGSDETTLRSVLRTADYPDILHQYPHELEIVLTYTLEGTQVRHTIQFTNRSNTAAPFGYGLHTWFMLDGEPEKWTLTLPVESLWELDDALMPSGRLAPLEGQLEKLRSGMPLEGANLDHVFQIGDNRCLAVLAKDGYTLRYSAPHGFKQWVIYTRGEAHKWICLEPYTWVTNAPNLDLPPEVTGFRAIAPGETIELDVLLEVERE